MSNDPRTMSITPARFLPRTSFPICIASNFSCPHTFLTARFECACHVNPQSMMHAAGCHRFKFQDDEYVSIKFFLRRFRNLVRFLSSSENGLLSNPHRYGSSYYGIVGYNFLNVNEQKYGSLSGISLVVLRPLLG
jgi:hypothetical protein